MRFSKRRYPLLAEWFKNIIIPVDIKSRFSSELVLELRRQLTGILALNGKIGSYVSRTLLEAAVENSQKLLELDHDKEIPTEPYLFITSKAVHVGMFTGGYGVGFYFEGQYLCAAAGRDQKNGFFHVCSDIVPKETAMAYAMIIPRVIYLFKKYAKTEIKILPARSTTKDFHCKYKNDLGIEIELLTENWYTQSVQGHPFMVRGHWRWQRHGEALKEQKLIFIDPFMKGGYTKGAYKDK